MERRNFLKNAVTFSMLIAMHRTAQFCTPAKSKESVKKSKARFDEIILYTSKLKEQLEFYSNTLGLKVITKSQTQFSLQIGNSVLKFKETKDGTEPFYHYAINIPSNKHKKAKEWLSKRTPILMEKETDDGIFYFDFWDAHAMYFKDPSGNIGELIARHTLENDSDGEFGVSDLLCISEIGTPVDDPIDFGSKLKSSYGLSELGESMFVGDEHGVFVVVPNNRNWFPEFIQKAKVYPTEIYLTDKGPNEFKYKDYPYKIGKKQD